MSSDTGILKMSPVNSHNVCLASIPEVPSNTCNRLRKYLSPKCSYHTLQGYIYCQIVLLNTSILAWIHLF